jgi:hypothetical protein
MHKYCFFLFLDSLLYLLWQQNRNLFKTYQELIECLQVTPRTKQSVNNDIKHILKYITWTLNVNISVVTISQLKNSYHKYDYEFRYKFQNSLVKLLKTPHKYKQITVILFKKKYYILKDECKIFPVLINVNPQSIILYKNKQILSSHILDIVEDRNTNTFPFTINIYTSYSFLKNASLKHIQNNFIGQYVHIGSNEVLHILVTPDLTSNNSIMINQLQLPTNTLQFNKHNLFANCQITEGDNIFKHTLSKEITLNQNFCICDHEETQRYISTRKSPILGMEHIIQVPYTS